MSVAAVMLVKDEADIIRPVVEHLLDEVDQILVADNSSTDGTREILAGLSSADLIVYDDNEPGYYQSDKTSRLAQVAYRHGHSWVVPCDADEVWYSPHGRLGDVLDQQPREVLFAAAPLVYHLATGADPPDVENPLHRLGWRFRPGHEPSHVPKVACRAAADLRIGMGNHDAVSFGRVRSDRSHTAEGLVAVRHFPWRSEEHLLRKIANGARAYAAAPEIAASFGEHWRAHGMPEDPGFADSVRTWFREWAFAEFPFERDDLMYDPVWRALAARAHMPPSGPVPPYPADSSGWPLDPVSSPDG